MMDKKTAHQHVRGDDPTTKTVIPPGNLLMASLPFLGRTFRHANPKPRIEERLATMVKKLEEFLLGTGEIQPALFLYNGTKA